MNDRCVIRKSVAGVKTRRQKPKNVAAMVALTFGLVLVLGRVQAAAPLTTAPLVTAPPELAHHVDVGGHSLYIKCTGTGSPTVMMEAGYGDASEVWAEVFSEVAAFTKVCVYDRAGLGQSDFVEQRTVREVVADIKALIENCPVAGPLILVGHSIGSLIVNMVAHEAPEKVAGLVLIDSSHPNQLTRFREHLPQAWLEALDTFFAGTPGFETWSSDAATAQGETLYMRAGSLGSTPLVVLTRDVEHIDPDGIAWIKENIWDSYSAEVDRLYGQAWLELQREYLALSTASFHTIVKDSTHYIQKDRPDAVTGAIRQVVIAARKRKDTHIAFTR